MAGRAKKSESDIGGVEFQDLEELETSDTPSSKGLAIQGSSGDPTTSLTHWLLEETGTFSEDRLKRFELISLSSKDIPKEIQHTAHLGSSLPIL
jgi:hypothetical protein